MLRGPVQEWYIHLKPLSDISFTQHAKEFKLYILGNVHPRPLVTMLLKLGQEEEVTLYDFVTQTKSRSSFIRAPQEIHSKTLGTFASTSRPNEETDQCHHWETFLEGEAQSFPWTEVKDMNSYRYKRSFEAHVPYLREAFDGGTKTIQLSEAKLGLEGRGMGQEDVEVMDYPRVVLRLGVTREWVDEGRLPNERIQSKVEEALRCVGKGHT
ncbi:hypothetical protein C4D60_Mb01t27840 [Musa balbisiana]|uniref:Retrotransposon gag domain-containing protein n=1 Tax=Musa balbisiana TaxID=52838 RepID=A0A4S8JR84_MUSBA|nr:hypothetical protein C4D60_Mb01t27840 [Musa balbisiana]